MVKMIGDTFCEFLMSHLKTNFEKIPKDMKLYFSNIKLGEKDVLWEGEKSKWVDSRIDADGNEYMAVWWIKGKGDFSLKYFFKIIINELEQRFSDILYLEQVEKQIPENGSVGSLVAFFVGKLLDKEWIRTQYIGQILKEKKLPSKDLLIQFSAQKYENRTVNTRMYFIEGSYEKTNKMLIFDDELDSDSWKERELSGDNLRTIRKLMEMSACFKNSTF